MATRNSWKVQVSLSGSPNSLSFWWRCLSETNLSGVESLPGWGTAKRQINTKILLLLGDFFLAASSQNSFAMFDFSCIRSASLLCSISFRGFSTLRRFSWHVGNACAS